MSKIELRRWFIFIIIIIIYWGYADISTTSEGNKQMIEALHERNALDSLYMEHLNQCNFLRKEDIRVDKNGYFYDVYKKEF